MRAGLRSVSRFAFAAFALAAVSTASAARAQVSDEGPDHAARRQEYFEQPRRYPFLRIPAGALLNARRDVEARFGLLARSSLLPSALAVGSTWRSIGPTTINNGSAAGRVAALAMHPTTPGVVYTGAAQGGVWRSVNAGATWTALGDTQCSLAIGSIAIDPVNPKIVYAGTGEQNNSADSYYGCGVLRSVDGGDTWTVFGSDVFVSPTGGGARIGHILIDRASAGTTNAVVLASSSFGLYRSTNAGNTWTRVLAGNVSGLVADPANSRTYYAAVGNYGTTASQNGIFKSIDNGVTWTPLTIAFGTTVGRIELAIAKSDANVLYATVEDRTPGSNTSTQLLGIWRSLDAGATWVKTTATGASCSSQCWYDMYVGVDPTNPGRVYFGGLSFYRSEDSATTFTNVGATIHVDHHTMVFDPSDPNTIYVGSDGGVYRSANRGTSWTPVNTNLAITQFYNGVSLHPTDTNAVLGGTQDNGTVQFIGNPSWSSVIGSDGGYTAINPQDPTIVYGETQWSAGSTVSGPRRREPGTNFRVRNIGIDINDRAQFIPPLVMDQAHPTTLYFGTYRLYRTGDGGDTWTPISPDLSKTGGGTITAIGLAPTDPKTVYVGLNDGNVRVTRDSGATWQTIASGLPNRVVTQIVVDDQDASKAHLTMSGFGTPHVWRTDNAGTSWTNVSGDLPNVPANSFAIVPRSNDIYVGTDLGMFRSVNGGQNWVPFQQGFPNVAVFSVVVNDRTRQLVAATHGRGMFSYSLPAQMLRGDVDGDGKVTAADAQLVLMAAVGLPLPAGVFAFPNGDVNCDGATTALDAQIILSFVVGQSTGQFCVNTVR